MGVIRWLLWTLFLLIALFSGLVARACAEDATALQIWIGVSLTFATAGLVDLVAWLDARRRRAEYQARIEPFHRIVDARIAQQRSSLWSTVRVAYDEPFASAEVQRWPELLRASDPVIYPESDVTHLIPIQSRHANIVQLSGLIREQQRDLDGLASGGYRSNDIRELDNAARAWLSFLRAIAVTKRHSSGSGKIALPMLEAIALIAPPLDPPTSAS